MKKSKVMRLYLISRWFYKHKVPIIPKIIRKLIRLLFSAEIPYTADIHKTVEMKHGALGVVIHDKTTIGEYTIIYQHVTIGGRENRGHPNIGKNVYIGCGACILGGINIGDNVRIGANAVVLKDIESGKTVVGIPAKEVISIEKNKD